MRMQRCGRKRFLKLKKLKILLQKILIKWLRLRSGDATFKEYESFWLLYDDWPGLKLLRKKAEEKIGFDREDNRVLNFFPNSLPLTGVGSFVSKSGTRKFKKT